MGLIAWELWYFLGPRQAVAPKSDGAQEIKVTVKGGYDPSTIFVEAGRPVRLRFYRDEEADCSRFVVFESLSIERELPPFQTTTIEFTPESTGDYPFRCGESVLEGTVVAREARSRKNPSGHFKHG